MIREDQKAADATGFFEAIRKVLSPHVASQQGQWIERRTPVQFRQEDPAVGEPTCGRGGAFG
jgi:hypothetical protein